MAYLGRINQLEVVKSVDFGLYLDGDDFGEVLIPKRYVPEHTIVHDWLEVFLYLDSEDKVIATTEIPKVMVGGAAALKVVDVNRVGAFVDWGLSKDLLIPFSEQRVPLEVGQYATVYVYIDEASRRIVGTTKLDKYLYAYAEPGELAAGETVELLIAQRSDIGYTAIINNSHLGMLFSNELSQPLKLGQRMPGVIKAIRDDGKVDLSITRLNKDLRDELNDKIMQALIDHDANSDQPFALTEKSSPADIHQRFAVSKGNYKKALGGLYRQKMIELNAGKVTLTDAGRHYFDG